MFNLKKELYINQTTTISDFGRLIVFHCEWEELDKVANNEIPQYLTAKFGQYNVEKLSEIAKKLYEVLYYAASDSPSSFPHAYDKNDDLQKFSHVSYNANYRYKINQLIDFVINEFGNFPCVLPSWAQSYVDSLSNNHSPKKELEGYIKIDSLPKIMQLMIKICNDPEYDKNNPSYDEDSAISTLDSLAIRGNVYYGNNQRTVKGLGDINAKKILMYIQKDTN
jgi:hypothetical protein